MYIYINVIYIYTGYNLQQFNNREKETAVNSLIHFLKDTILRVIQRNLVK